jgi:cyclohexadieny/prephenate dehydrogenase
MISKLAIIGPGLLGGSLMYAMRARSADTKIAVWARRLDAVEIIRALTTADIASTDIATVVSDAELIVLCVPIGAMPSLAEKIAPLVSDSAIVTDVGSVKSFVVRSLDQIFAGKARFVGSHPMAGSEMTGLSAARADLFQDSVCIITPSPQTSPTEMDLISGFWQVLGCRIRILTPEEHDRIVALVSHLPHLVAAALMHLTRDAQSDALEFSGNGFRDTTRVASGAPEMWTEIFATNREPLKNAAQAMIEKLQRAVRLLETCSDKEMMQFLTQAKAQRDSLRSRK